MKALATELERLIAKLPAHETPVARPTRTPAKRNIRDLPADELAAMIADYQGGATLRELAAKHGHNRVGISGALKRAGVQLRNQGLNAEQIDQAVNLYQGGMSLARIGARFDVNATTVRTRLIERGVTMRQDPSEGELRSLNTSIVRARLLQCRVGMGPTSERA